MQDQLLDFRFFFNATATTEIYTLSLHDALPISPASVPMRMPPKWMSSPTLIENHRHMRGPPHRRDRKSTRLNSSHMSISYAVFCLKTKTTKQTSANCANHQKQKRNT